MSYVTSAVIVVDFAYEVKEDLLTKPQGFGRESGYEQGFARLDEGKCGGGKVFQGTVYAAGFNHIDSEKLVEWFLALPWSHVDRAVLLFDDEGENNTVVPVGDWKMVVR